MEYSNAVVPNQEQMEENVEHRAAGLAGQLNIETVDYVNPPE